VKPSGFVLPRWSIDPRYVNTELDLKEMKKEGKVSPRARTLQRDSCSSLAKQQLRREGFCIRLLCSFIIYKIKMPQKFLYKVLAPPIFVTP
jgi:hypothetical protein